MSYVKLKNKNLNMKNKWVLYGNHGLVLETFRCTGVIPTLSGFNRSKCMYWYDHNHWDIHHNEVGKCIGFWLVTTISFWLGTIWCQRIKLPRVVLKGEVWCTFSPLNVNVYVGAQDSILYPAYWIMAELSYILFQIIWSIAFRCNSSLSLFWCGLLCCNTAKQFLCSTERIHCAVIQCDSSRLSECVSGTMMDVLFACCLLYSCAVIMCVSCWGWQGWRQKL